MPFIASATNNKTRVIKTCDMDTLPEAQIRARNLAIIEWQKAPEEKADWSMMVTTPEGDVWRFVVVPPATRETWVMDTKPAAKATAKKKATRNA
jgi:hypothetical protein